MAVPTLFLALAATSPAEAASGRLALGVSGATGISPVEPTWSQRGPGSAAVGCVGLAGWWITGGHDYAGSRGEVLRTSDDTRWGLAGSLCPTSSGALSGGAGVSYGRQWGGQLYVTSNLTAGLSAYGKDGPGATDYTAFAPYAKPELALGLALPPGMSVEVGPYLWVAPPLLQLASETRPLGMYVGHVGLEITVLAGSTSPQVPWRRR